MSEDSRKKAAKACHLVTSTRGSLVEDFKVMDVEQEVDWIETSPTAVLGSQATNLCVTARSK